MDLYCVNPQKASPQGNRVNRCRGDDDQGDHGPANGHHSVTGLMARLLLVCLFLGGVGGCGDGGAAATNTRARSSRSLSQPICFSVGCRNRGSPVRKLRSRYVMPSRTA